MHYLRTLTLSWLALATCSTPLCGNMLANPSPFSATSITRNQIQVNNRILADINGHSLSLWDIVQEMDKAFDTEYSDEIQETDKRYIFYQQNWKYFLENRIDQELILADAEDKKLPVNDGEIRREIEEIFGPNIMENLNQANISFQTAWEQVRRSILLRRMMYIRVQSKVNGGINPQALKEAYQQYISTQAEPDAWTYRMLSIRSDDETLAASIAEQAYRMLDGGSELGETIEKLSDIAEEQGVKVALSKKIQHNANTISAGHKNAISQLQAGEFSLPINQISRASKQIVSRIFFLDDYIKSEPVTYQDIEPYLQKQIRSKLMAKESQKYLVQLRDQYQVSADDSLRKLPKNYQPFSLL